MKPISTPIRIFVLLLIAIFTSRASAGGPTTHPVKVILWFDTEDYLLPADDDAAKRIAEMLTERHIRGTFKVVGEKARVLEKRGRRDVIDALRLHDIGYHSNLHSVHPAPAEYLADCGLLDGMDEFIRHEARGAADVRRIFSVPALVCYGQPGSSWAPQAVAALGECGISNDGVPCYLDSGHHIGLAGKPYWFEGAINVYDLRDHETRMNLWDTTEPEVANKKFDEMVARVKAEGGGLISIYYHPCEFVHEEFWDAVNFKRGDNPPREEWKAERQRPAAETEAAFTRYGKYLDHMRADPDVEFVSASQLPAMYPDRLKTEGATPDEVLELARRIIAPDSKGIDFQIIGNKAFSPADQFALICEAADRAASTDSDANPAKAFHVPARMLGPDGEPPAPAAQIRTLSFFQLRDAAHDALDYVQTKHRMPARVFIGPDAVRPADFLFAVAKFYVLDHDNHSRSATFELGSNVEVLTARHVIQDGPKVYGGWIIHREGFQAPKVLEVTRLQAWTLKPTIAR